MTDRDVSLRLRFDLTIEVKSKHKRVFGEKISRDNTSADAPDIFYMNLCSYSFQKIVYKQNLLQVIFLPTKATGKLILVQYFS